MSFLFATIFVVVDDCGLDLERLETKCRLHSKKQPSESLSNIGGYQGHHFTDNELSTLVRNNLPQREDKPIKNIKLEMWANINGPGHSNERHHHNPHSGTFMSGVFYVKCPENSGSIRFYDPRPHIDTTPDNTYYSDGSKFIDFLPSPNTLLIFPPWLEHSVEPNQSEEDRLSISFNFGSAIY